MLCLITAMMPVPLSFHWTLAGQATQHYAGIWSGDQTGGEWGIYPFSHPYLYRFRSVRPAEYLLGYGRYLRWKNAAVNIRDFQWKHLPHDAVEYGWLGAPTKNPHVLGEPATSINRMYLKLKSGTDAFATV